MMSSSRREMMNGEDVRLVEQEVQDHDDKQQPSKFRFIFSTPFLLALALLGMAGIRHYQHSRTPSVSLWNVSGQQRHRKALAYSVISAIPEDPSARMPGDDVREELGAKYGHWHFWDGDEENRPDDSDMCTKYANCDVLGDDFSDESWQGDAVFVNHILNEADELVTRAMEAIFEEYGHPKPDTAEGLAERMKMFHWEKIDLAEANEAPPQYKKNGSFGGGGWTTKRSFQGLVRRILHAMMTNGEFTVVVVGHSSAAGHGNHFRQSYIMQMHKVLAPVFARLGMKLVTRNLSMGGLGTLQTSLGARDLIGNKVDLLIWDSGMTENHSAEAIDFFFRQALLLDHIPVLWSPGQMFPYLKKYHEEADADVGEFGHGWDGITETTSDAQAKTLPWAVQYLKCDAASSQVCKSHNSYCAKCWVDREDGVKPEAEQRSDFGGQVSWHPGWREHQLQGRVIAFSILEAMQAAIQQFSDGTMGGPPLSDEVWHLTDYFDNIRNKAKVLDLEESSCKDVEKFNFPKRICQISMKGRTEYTPRTNPDETSLRSILKAAPDGYVPKSDKQPLYEGLDAHNDCFDIPDDEVDVLAIVSGRRRRRSMKEVSANISRAAAKFYRNVLKKETTRVHREVQPKQKQRRLATRERRDLEEIVPGKGWELSNEPEGYCDGSYYTHCNRDTNFNCILANHHDTRASLVGTALSGWLVMTLKGVKEGVIILKVHSWARNGDNHITTDWSTENNERRRMLEFENFSNMMDPSKQRSLKGDPAQDFPDNFKFEFAINGKITSWTKAQYIEHRMQSQRMIETFTLLDDPNFTTEETDVEVAVRLHECGHECTIGISHIYWA